jgi:hypothetical protein
MAKSRIHPSSARKSSTAVPYVDEDRDFRDVKVLSAIRSAIVLIEEMGQSEDACNVLRLVRDSLEASWPKTNVKFTTAEVDHV